MIDNIINCEYCGSSFFEKHLKDDCKCKSCGANLKMKKKSAETRYPTSGSVYRNDSPSCSSGLYVTGMWFGGRDNYAVGNHSVAIGYGNSYGGPL